MSLDKHLHDRKIVAASLRLIEVGQQVAAAKKNVSQANRDHRCTRGTVLDCTHITKIGKDWCFECYHRHPFHDRLKVVVGYEKTALNNLKQLCEQRERQWPSKPTKL